MSIGVLLRGFIGDMMDFGDVILRTLFPSFMTIQACMHLNIPYPLIFCPYSCISAVRISVLLCKQTALLTANGNGSLFVNSQLLFI